jgi:hypothetical protein
MSIFLNKIFTSTAVFDFLGWRLLNQFFFRHFTCFFAFIFFFIIIIILSFRIYLSIFSFSLAFLSIYIFFHLYCNNYKQGLIIKTIIKISEVYKNCLNLIIVSIIIYIYILECRNLKFIILHCNLHYFNI